VYTTAIFRVQGTLRIVSQRFFYKVIKPVKLIKFTMIWSRKNPLQTISANSMERKVIFRLQIISQFQNKTIEIVSFPNNTLIAAHICLRTNQILSIVIWPIIPHVLITSNIVLQQNNKITINSELKWSYLVTVMSDPFKTDLVRFKKGKDSSFAPEHPRIATKAKLRTVRLPSHPDKKKPWDYLISINIWASNLDTPPNNPIAVWVRILIQTQLSLLKTRISLKTGTKQIATLLSQDGLPVMWTCRSTAEQVLPPKSKFTTKAAFKYKDSILPTIMFLWFMPVIRPHKKWILFQKEKLPLPCSPREDCPMLYVVATLPISKS